MRSPLALAILLSACAITGVPLDPNPGAPSATAGRVELLTRDDVLIVGDSFPASVPGRPGVVLVHMTPRGPWVRSDWPDSFVEALVAEDIAVIRIDRRGAGESGGVAEEAYTGETGRYDVEAAVLHLADMGLGTLAVVGASNGSTSALDYAVWAGSAGLPEVDAIAMMSPGAYTENQTSLTDISDLPVLFQYPSTEAEWPGTQQLLERDAWTFTEYAGSAHGTQLFAEGPAPSADLVSFLMASLTE